MSKVHENLVGMEFGRLTVDEQFYKGSFRWCKVTCVCGTKKEVMERNLLIRNTSSCGCLLKEYLAENSKRFIKHGLSGTPEYRAWLSMKGRCFRETDISYKYYGGRGITVCDWWRYDPSQFCKDIPLRPSPQHSLDRINNDGHYSCGHCSECLENRWPMNVRWATKKEQIQTRRPSAKLGFTSLATLNATFSKSKPFIATSPSGQIFFGIGLKQFSDINGLNPESMYRVASGKSGSHRGGWSCEYIGAAVPMHI